MDKTHPSQTQSEDNWGWLMAQAQEGNSHHFVTLLQEVSTFLRPFLLQRMGGMDQAEDVLQEILLTLHRARHTYDPTRPFKPWLYAVANSRVMEFWRKHKKREEFESPLIDEQTEMLIAEEDISRFELETLKQALDQLSESQQEIIRLLKIEGHSVKEVAEKLSMSEAAVKVAAHRGYKKIFEAFHHGR